MSQPNEELLRGVHTDLSHSKASTHAPKLELSKDNGNYSLGIDISAHAEEYLHHTSWLKIFVGDTPVGQIDLEPPFQTGKFEIDLTEIDPGEDIRVQAKCNLHGIWENSVTAD